MYAALLLATLAAVSAAPQQFGGGGGGFNGFPPGPGGRPPPVYYDDDEDDSSSSDDLTFFQRLIRPWRWFDPVLNYFNGSGDDEEEVYDEGNFPGRFPGQQVARLDQLRPAVPPQRYVARPPAAARSDPAPYRPEQMAAEAVHEQQTQQ